MAFNLPVVIPTSRVFTTAEQAWLLDRILEACQRNRYVELKTFTVFVRNYRHNNIGTTAKIEVKRLKVCKFKKELMSEFFTEYKAQLYQKVKTQI